MAGKWLMYDNSVRVPLIIYDPRVKKHYDVNDMVANVDLAATILDFAGVKSDLKTHGMSLVPYVNSGSSKDKREELMIEHLWDFQPIPASEGIRTEQWKYFRYININAPEELYDLENDPQELNNLAINKEYKNILQNMRNKLDLKITLYSK